MAHRYLNPQQGEHHRHVSSGMAEAVLHGLGFQVKDEETLALPNPRMGRMWIPRGRCSKSLFRVDPRNDLHEMHAND